MNEDDVQGFYNHELAVTTPGLGLVNTPWPVTSPEPAPTISEAKEIEIREASIKYTIKMFGNNTEVGLDEFCKLLDAVYEYMRYGTKIKTINN
jgi:hypothetical protein